MNKIRVRYKKTGKAKYISHLDLMTVMQRAFIRAGVSLEYSDGYNPHPYISVALPSPVGITSVCEILDTVISGGSISRDVNKFLPEGLEIEKAYRPWRNFSDIKWVETECRLCFDEVPNRELYSILNGLFSAQSLLITKKTKRGESVIDAAAHIRDAKVSRDDENDVHIRVTAKFSAQEPTIGYRDILNIFGNAFTNCNSNIKYLNNIEMKRIELFDRSMVLFK